jgi:hypothetical protein
VRRLAAPLRWLRAHLGLVGVAVVALAAGVAAGYLIAGEDDEAAQVSPAAPAPQVVIQEAPIPEETPELGFPEFATKNTTRVSGADPATDAAGVALAVYPSATAGQRPDAVALVDASEWQAGIAAASLVADPVGAPVLVTDDGQVPQLTASALRKLNPKGAGSTAGNQVFAVGAAARPEGYETVEVKGSDPAEVAAGVARLRERLGGDPAHILVIGQRDPALAMPAAAWAARSGDPVLFVAPDSVPDATREALRRYDEAPVYVLGPESAVSQKVMKEIEKIDPTAERIGAEDPAENAILFARYASGNFGWNINDPGHGFVIVNADRPLDAAAAAPLSASGTWGPLLVTDDADVPPEALGNYLLDLKPGYRSDPTRALYNHVWLVGDTDAISVRFQARIDQLAEVVPVTSGSGASELGPLPGTPESQPDDEQNR